ncbi:MAG: DUF4861 domain-containing protein, partial [Lentisphaerae bacterium]|nr:DUF4861 domain-containing protein [Lentisphaerota bacterium]
MNVLRKLAGLAGCCAAGLAMLGTTGAAVVAERELLLRHTLGTERQAEVIVVSLRDLDVSTADVGRIKGVQVLDERGTLLVSQFDNLADELDSSLTEVAFEIDLPGSVRRVTVRLLDHVVAQPAVCTVELADDRVTVTTPAYTVPVRRDGAAGLWVEQPELKVADAQKIDDAMDAMLAGLDAPAPTAGGGRSRTARSG